MPTLGTFRTLNSFAIGTFWKLTKPVNCYANQTGPELSTQLCIGRNFEVLQSFNKESSDEKQKRIRVRSLEDGYLSWVQISDVFGSSIPSEKWEPYSFTYQEIIARLSAVLTWVDRASRKPNQYLWGGSLGPNFDCSGLVQSAFASQDIWIPRDAYQQEHFCKPVRDCLDDYKALIPGDLLFFGSHAKCTHVAIYKGEGFYWHSSGPENGHNGICLDGLDISDRNSVAFYYRSKFRGAGRVYRCHDGTTLP